MYNVDFAKMINELLPEKLRQPLWLKWLAGLASPMIKVHNAFISNRNANLYKMAHNGQVFSLTKVLNGRFDTTGRRIYISDGFTKDRVYVYKRIEVKPIYLDTIYIHNRADYVDTGVDFIVWVPVAVFISPQDLIEMEALVKLYKLASKRFKIYRV